MSDEPSPEVRALAAKLFAAGRAERPGAALGRRLLLIEPAADRSPPSALEGDASVERRAVAGRGPSRVALWLAAAALIAGGVGLSFVLEPDPRPISISPEREPERAPSTPGEHVARVPAPHTASEATPEPSAAGVAPPDDDTARVAPRREAAARPRTTERRRSVDSATPPSVTPSGPASAAPAAPKPMTLLAELDLLKRARTALRAGDGGQALELLTQRAREHTSNGLDAEATLLRIEALAALGKQGEASELATRFVRENPSSALGDRAKSFIRVTAPRP